MNNKIPMGIEEEINGFIEDLESNDVNIRITASALLRLRGKMAKKAVPAQIKALEDKDARVRSTTANALGDINDEIAIPALIKILEDDDADARFASLYALNKMYENAKKAIPVLLRMLEKEDDEEIREWAEDLLIKLGHKNK